MKSGYLGGLSTVAAVDTRCHSGGKLRHATWCRLPCLFCLPASRAEFSTVSPDRLVTDWSRSSALRLLCLEGSHVCNVHLARHSPRSRNQFLKPRVNTSRLKVEQLVATSGGTQAPTYCRVSDISDLRQGLWTFLDRSRYSWRMLYPTRQPRTIELDMTLVSYLFPGWLEVRIIL
ncbi:hypothetical protein RRG08_008506 [Elysia crispata]|uniref:Uncharacterized protein n=1 Tax=Elysia crispata TaxID=231223 RepID=A0AAE0Z858_9GAST|nr:hypothetical protein RRG08_008506 [Elysia crispata]